ncbi:hypothetical protein C8A00DRAFT_33948 [Chaetomidium leptoderma]|uniref:Zn(2)-C6 fungal-type domain-containing protein n=1 Tax=Chaetomidium leptoderma TaxID=669021 RepID=A0AAN6ZWX0_9PEZI|nr:hypothetical protein C8A00DRAFT_33948 [Chaetomidium leptoderma]
MKTRCVRTPEARACLRCTRLSIACTFSPPGRTGRPLGSGRGQSRAASDSQSNVGSSPAESDPPMSSLHGASMPDTPLPTGLSDADLFGETDCNYISASFMEALPLTTSLPSDSSPCSPGSPRFSLPQPSHKPPGAQEQDQQLVLDAYSNTAYSNTRTQLPLVEDDDMLGRLLDLQARLATLVKLLRGGSRGREEIEDAFRAGETLIRLLDSFGGPALAPPVPVLPDGVTVLLLSGCYASLIHAYELTVEMLRQELCEAGTKITTTSMPTISVGAIRMPMPPRAVAEIHLHLITQMVHQLRGALQQCAARMAASKTTSCACTAHPRFEVFGQCHQGATCERALSSTLMGLARPALLEVGWREEVLITMVQAMAFTSNVV